MAKRTPDEMLRQVAAQCFAKPLHWTMFVFPWLTDPTIRVCPFGGPDPNNRWRTMIREDTGVDYAYGPDEWTCEFLYNWGLDIEANAFDGIHPVAPLQYSISSGHGIGKSATSSFIAKFIMDTRPLAQGKMTAGSEGQLKSRTWAELGKWNLRSKTGHWYEYAAGRGSMRLAHKKYPGEWKVEGQSCREENAQNFAGQHAVTSTSFYVFDEASEIADKIYETRDGGLTDGEPMTFDFGNPVRNSGIFFEECFGRLKEHMTGVWCIDSRDVHITNKEYINGLLAKANGDEENDYFRVRVRGVAPSQSSIQFISGLGVKRAMLRPTPPHHMMKDQPLIIGVDVARDGPDSTVIWPRIGMDCRSFEPKIFRGMDTTWTIGETIDTIRTFRERGKECSGLFIDGGNTGGAVIDQLRNLGYDVIEVKFGRTATDRTRYRYVMDEIWGKMRDAIDSGLILPEFNTPLGQDLYYQLIQREYMYVSDRIALESKRDMKKRGLESPDLPDALACTFFQEVENVSYKEDNGMMGHNGGPPMDSGDYDPYSRDRLDHDRWK